MKKKNSFDILNLPHSLPCTQFICANKLLWMNIFNILSFSTERRTHKTKHVLILIRTAECDRPLGSIASSVFAAVDASLLPYSLAFSFRRPQTARLCICYSLTIRFMHIFRELDWTSITRQESEVKQQQQNEKDEEEEERQSHRMPFRSSTCKVYARDH